MNAPQRILAALESEEHGPYLIDKVVQLRDCASAELVFAKTCYDAAVDDAALHFSPSEHDELVDLETRVERIKFRHFIGANALDQAWDATVAWNRQTWRGAIDVAHNRACDLIVKDTYVERRLDGAVVHTAHDWDLLQHATVPVMMLKPFPWAANGVVLAAVDVFDPHKQALNHHVVRYAQGLAGLLRARLHVVNVVPLSPGIAVEYGIADYPGWLSRVSDQRRRALDRLLEDSGVEPEQVHVRDGVPWQVVAGLVEELGAESLVIGKVRTGVQRYLDTTSERLLHAVTSDLVSVP